MLIATNISQRISGKTILESCSLKIKPGTFTAIVGPNGAGKTTLLKAISGENKKFRGEVSLNDKPLHRYKTSALSKTRAVLPQQTVVNFPFTVEQVIEIGRYAHRTTHAENEQIIASVMDMTGLSAFRGRTYQTLSGGEKQRVQLARVIAQIWDESPAPKYLLLDEPTSSLDLAQQHALLSLARNLSHQNIAVLAVLHDLNLAAHYADDILFLKNGKPIAYGPLREITTQQVIAQAFGYPVRILEDQGQLIIVPRAVQTDQTDTHYQNGLSLTNTQPCEKCHTLTTAMPVGGSKYQLLKNFNRQTNGK
jgi:iron complex transport system ATP-binding protein